MRPKCSRSGKTSDCSGKNAPPESTRYTHGRLILHRDSCARRCFFTVSRIVGAALHGRIVGHDSRPRGPASAADAGDDSRARRLVCRTSRRRRAARTPGTALSGSSSSLPGRVPATCRAPDGGGGIALVALPDAFDFLAQFFSTAASISAKFCRYSGLEVLMRLSIRSIGVLSVRSPAAWPDACRV